MGERTILKIESGRCGCEIPINNDVFRAALAAHIRTYFKDELVVVSLISEKTDDG